jgi:DNA-directed RNA polymerase subunit RPC12/RpoP
MPKQKTQEEWLNSIPKEHKDKFDYSKAVYTKSQNKVLLTCKKCSTEFMQRADMNTRGVGCKVCQHRALHASLVHTKEMFIERSQEEFGDKYGYELVKYVDKYTKVDIICRKEGHGIFQVTPANLKKGRHSCPKCAGEAISKAHRKTQEDFVEECRALCAEGITFEHVKYSGDKTNVMFNCATHGIFDMLPGNFLKGCRCPSCASYGYRKALPGRFYILSDGYTTKVGVTNKEPEYRAKSVAKTGGPIMDIMVNMFFADGAMPLKIETACLRYLKTKYKSPSSTFDGATECFLGVDIPDLLNFISPIASTAELEQSGL